MATPVRRIGSSLRLVSRLAPRIEDALALRRTGRFATGIGLDFKQCRFNGGGATPEQTCEPQYQLAFHRCLRVTVRPSMTSSGQIEANRRNALRHGLTAETVISTLENAEDYKAFETAVIAPSTAIGFVS